MNGPEIVALVGGLLLGLGASLHCAGMCGGIASSILFTLDPGTGPGGRARALLIAQAGRVATYVAAGAAVGGFGTAVFGALDQTMAYRVLQWAAAATLVWIGASIAGLAPALSGFDRLAVPIVRRLTLATPGPGSGSAGAFASGIVWGALPCPMVHGALFTAMLTGNAGTGALAMLGFGLGTLPAVTGVALGLSRLKEFARGEKARLVVGLAIAATGLLALVLSLPGGPLCVTR